jgi:hypothetical protein
MDQPAQTLVGKKTDLRLPWHKPSVTRLQVSADTSSVLKAGSEEDAIRGADPGSEV